MSSSVKIHIIINVVLPRKLHTSECRGMSSQIILNDMTQKYFSAAKMMSQPLPSDRSKIFLLLETSTLERMISLSKSSFYSSTVFEVLTIGARCFCIVSIVTEFYLEFRVVHHLTRCGIWCSAFFGYLISWSNFSVLRHCVGVVFVSVIYYTSDDHQITYFHKRVQLSMFSDNVLAISDLRDHTGVDRCANLSPQMLNRVQTTLEIWDIRYSVKLHVMFSMSFQMQSRSWVQ